MGSGSRDNNGSAAGGVVILIIGICLAFAAKDGAFEGIGKGPKDHDKFSYRYYCDFVDFYGGVEMQTWEGTGKHRPKASTDPFGSVEDVPHPPAVKGIKLNLIARALTPTVPLPRGSRPSLECKIIQVDQTKGTEKVIRGPAKIKNRNQFIQMEVRAPN